MIIIITKIILFQGHDLTFLSFVFLCRTHFDDNNKKTETKTKKKAFDLTPETFAFLLFALTQAHCKAYCANYAALHETMKEKCFFCFCFFLKLEFSYRKLRKNRLVAVDNEWNADFAQIKFISFVFKIFSFSFFNFVEWRRERKQIQVHFLQRKRNGHFFFLFWFIFSEDASVNIFLQLHKSKCKDKLFFAFLSLHFIWLPFVRKCV